MDEKNGQRQRRAWASPKRLLMWGFLLVLFFLFVANLPGTWETLRTAAADGEVESQVVNIHAFSAAYDKGFFGKYGFINLNGLARRGMHQRVMNERVKMDNGYLTALMSWSDQMEVHADAVLELETVLAEKGIPLLFVQTPHKISPDDPQLPTGIVDYANANAEIFLARLRQGGMEPLDLRQSIRDQGLNHTSLFFRTDHHQRPETGYWMFQQVAEEMHRRYGFALDTQVMDRDSYRTEIYPDVFLGNDGKRTGRYYAGVEDMELVVPTFPTELSLSIPSEGEVRTGDFDQVMFVREHLYGSYYTDSAYLTYIGLDYPLVVHENTTALEKKKVLLLKDSCVLIIQPYFSLWMSQVHVVDLRYFREQSLMSYIEEEQFDAVVILYNPQALEWGQVFSFF